MVLYGGASIDRLKRECIDFIIHQDDDVHGN